MNRPMDYRGLLCALALSIVAISAPAAAGPDDDHGTPAVTEDELGGHVPGASVLEGRLLAPCCWNQTLDIHGSPSANALRKEIRQRLKKGESVDAVEAAIVERYGEKIRAVPKGSPLQGFATVLALSFGVAGGLSVWMLLRWRRRRAIAVEQASKTKPSGKRDRFDDALDAELEQL